MKSIIQQRTELGLSLGLLSYMIFDDHEIVLFKDHILQSYAQKYQLLPDERSLTYFNNEIFVLQEQSGVIMVFDRAQLTFVPCEAIGYCAFYLAASAEELLIINRQNNHLLIFDSNQRQRDHQYTKKISKMVSMQDRIVIETFEKQVFQYIDKQFVSLPYSGLEIESFGVVYGKSRLSNKWVPLDFSETNIAESANKLVNVQSFRFLRTKGFAAERNFLIKWCRTGVSELATSPKACEFLFDLLVVNTPNSEVAFLNLTSELFKEVWDFGKFHMFPVSDDF